MAQQQEFSGEPVAESVSNLVWRSIRSFATSPHEHPLTSISQDYELLVRSSTWQERLALYQAVLDDVHTRRLPALCLLPFVHFETEPGVIAPAVADLVTACETIGIPALDTVTELMNAVNARRCRSPGAVLAAAVHLGDRRFNALARTVRGSLSATEIRGFSRSQFETMSASAVEFCLDWLVHLQANGNVEAMSYVASHLILMVSHDRTGYVHDLSGTPASHGALVRPGTETRQPFTEYFQEILPMMNSIRNGSPEPRVLQAVIDRWTERAQASCGAVATLPG
jgi:hypothetical protein